VTDGIPGDEPPTSPLPRAPVSLPPLPPVPERRSRRGLVLPRWLVALVVVLVVGGIGFAIGWATTPGDQTTSSAAGTGSSPNQGGSPGTTGPTSPASPSTSVPSTSPLSRAGLRPSDVTASYGVVLLPDGNSVSGAATLDLCNGTFASESSRRERLQVAEADQQDANVALSTETVQYASGAATQQAFDELQQVVAACPSTPVPSPVGEPTVTTKFNAPPDGSWPQVAGVDRLAYDFVTTDQSGATSRSIAVYLRRGKVLMGVYFPSPDGNQPAIVGQTSVPGIVNVFAQRLAALPDSVVN